MTARDHGAVTIGLVWLQRQLAGAQNPRDHANDGLIVAASGHDEVGLGSGTVTVLLVHGSYGLEVLVKYAVDVAPALTQTYTSIDVPLTFFLSLFLFLFFVFTAAAWSLARTDCFVLGRGCGVARPEGVVGLGSGTISFGTDFLTGVQDLGRVASLRATVSDAAFVANQAWLR